MRGQHFLQFESLLYVIDKIKIYIIQTTCIQTLRDNTIGLGQTNLNPNDKNGTNSEFL